MNCSVLSAMINTSELKSFPAIGLNRPLGIRKVKTSGFFMTLGTVKVVRSILVN